MPNHETNTVAVIGTPENVEKFLAEAFTDKQIDFNKIVPPPANIEEGSCSGTHAPGVVCWYEWQIANWGTKWGAYAHQGLEYGKYQGYGEGGEIYGRADFKFDTAWSQPTPIFEKIEERWDVKVHAVTQDEGGHPDVEYGDPYDEEIFTVVTTITPNHWDKKIE